MNREPMQWGEEQIVSDFILNNISKTLNKLKRIYSIVQANMNMYVYVD
jgi:hypothetical protein